MLHLIRKGITEGCPVCGVDAFAPCVKQLTADSPPPLQLDLDLGGMPGEVTFLEFEIINAISRLRELRPNHTLVTVVAAVLKYQAWETTLPD